MIRSTEERVLVVDMSRKTGLKTKSREAMMKLGNSGDMALAMAAFIRWNLQFMAQTKESKESVPQTLEEYRIYLSGIEESFVEVLEQAGMAGFDERAFEVAAQPLVGMFMWMNFTMDNFPGHPALRFSTYDEFFDEIVPRIANAAVKHWSNIDEVNGSRDEVLLEKIRAAVVSGKMLLKDSSAGNSGITSEFDRGRLVGQAPMSVPDPFNAGAEIDVVFFIPQALADNLPGVTVEEVKTTLKGISVPHHRAKEGGVHRMNTPGGASAKATCYAIPMALWDRSDEDLDGSPAVKYDQSGEREVF